MPVVVRVADTQALLVHSKTVLLASQQLCQRRRTPRIAYYTARVTNDKVVDFDGRSASSCIYGTRHLRWGGRFRWTGRIFVYIRHTSPTLRWSVSMDGAHLHVYTATSPTLRWYLFRCIFESEIPKRGNNRVDGRLAWLTHS